jgi:hypothetical protein
MANLNSFNVGDVLLTYGMDMACHKCVVKTKVVEKNERGIVTYSDGCHILNSWENMEHSNDYFPYSVEKEKAMQKECDDAYNAWVEACKRQAEEAHRHHIERNERMKRIIKEKGYFDGTFYIIELSGKTNFFRWKKYDVLHINENLDLFGMSEDEDTMYVNIDDLPVPTQQQIVSEVKAAA